jgi:hypothetical protein
MPQLSNAAAASSPSQAPPELWDRIQGYFRPGMLIILGAYCKLSLHEYSGSGAPCKDRRPASIRWAIPLLWTNITS